MRHLPRRIRRSSSLFTFDLRLEDWTGRVVPPAARIARQEDRIYPRDPRKVSAVHARDPLDNLLLEPVFDHAPLTFASSLSRIPSGPSNIRVCLGCTRPLVGFALGPTTPACSGTSFAGFGDLGRETFTCPAWWVRITRCGTIRIVHAPWRFRWWATRE